MYDRVQSLLDSSNVAGEKKRLHHHYLKGTIWCGCCGSRLIVTNARGKMGVIYPYFVCVGRQRKRTSCTQRALSIDRVERVVEAHYRTVEMGDDLGSRRSR